MQAKTAETIDFTPSNYQRELKARFIVKVRNSKVYHDIWTRAACEQILGQSLARQGGIPGFKEWFLDTDEFEVAAELAAQEALAACREIMSDPGEKGQARVTAAKLVMLIADKEPKKVAVKYADEGISKLAGDPEKLKSFLLPAIKKAFSKEEILRLATSTEETDDTGTSD